MLTGDNGILMQGNNAKIETAVGAVKEQVNLLQIEKKIKNENLTPETLLAEGKVSRTVYTGKNGKYYMYYALKEETFREMQGLGKGNIASLKDVFLIDDDLNVKYIAKDGKEYGDKINEKILEDETEIKFSSKEFSEYISKILGVPKNEIKFKWLKNQTSLQLINLNLSSLEDLIFFPNLTSIYIQNMILENLNGIENCSKLHTLTIIDVKIKEYKQLTLLNNIETLYVQGPVELKDIVDNIKDYNKLRDLSLYSANLENVELLSKLKNIESLNKLNLGANKIKNVKPLEDLKNLTELDLGSNLITDISPLKELTKLKLLNLRKNNIKDITPLSENKELMNLNLKENPQIEGDRNKYSEEGIKALDEISKILERNGKIYLDTNQIRLFNNYKDINLSSQNLTNLEILDGYNNLETLNLNFNRLTLEDKKSQEILSNMSNLKYLYLQNQNNLLTNISAINNLKNLKILYIEQNDNINLQQIEDVISNLDNLRLSTEALKTIKNCNTDKIQKLNIDYSMYLTEIPDLSQFNNLKKLSMINLQGVKDFSIISKLSNIEILTLSANDLHGKLPDFSKMKSLKVLSLSNCKLWNEDLEKLKVLKNNTNLTINLANNSIIDASALLELHPNTNINLTGNVNLSQDSKDKLREKFGSNVTF